MNHKRIAKLCKDLGCCDACCLRYLGIRSPSSYENVNESIDKYLDTNSSSQTPEVAEKVETNVLELETDTVKTNSDPVCIEHGEKVGNGNKDTEQEATNTDSIIDDGSSVTTDAPPAKRIKLDSVCVSCLGVLQEQNWPQCYSMVQEVLDNKCYECDTIACALSSPIACIVRERAVALQLQDAFPDYELKCAMPLKEAWKWSFGRRLAAHVNKRLDSGAVAPLLVTLTLEYADDARELEALRALAPAAAWPPRRELTRRAVEQALQGATAAALGRPPRAGRPARPAAAAAAHAPAYVGGRYLKLSRTLPQTPWLVAGRRMLRSSVQEIIVGPLAAAYGLSAEEGARRIKFVSAGREDVDVRCLGSGRPFALEVADPRRLPAADELARACAAVCASGEVLVRELVPVTREELAQLKQGEESKEKTYEALCIKLERCAGDTAGAVAVTARDLANLAAAGGAQLRQRTPLRVLHRRALRTRARRLLAVSARRVRAHAALFVVRVRAQAGTYIKEWAHGELRRTRPALADALGARADILALDVADVDLAWPPARPVPAVPAAPAVPDQ